MTHREYHEPSFCPRGSLNQCTQIMARIVSIKRKLDVTNQLCVVIIIWGAARKCDPCHCCSGRRGEGGHHLNRNNGKFNRLPGSGRWPEHLGRKTGRQQGGSCLCFRGESSIKPEKGYELACTIIASLTAGGGGGAGELDTGTPLKHHSICRRTQGKLLPSSMLCLKLPRGLQLDWSYIHINVRSVLLQVYKGDVRYRWVSRYEGKAVKSNRWIWKLRLLED